MIVERNSTAFFIVRERNNSRIYKGKKRFKKFKEGKDKTNKFESNIKKKVKVQAVDIKKSFSCG